MSNKRVFRWSARLAALLVAAALIPACSMLKSNSSGGINWSSNSTGNVTAVPVVTPVLWYDPNTAIQGPIGIWGIGGVEITYGMADPANFPASNPEAPHPVSTSRSLDPTGESVINSMVQQLYVINIGGAGGAGGAAGIGGVVVGPVLYTGEPKLAAVARARSKHQSLHPGAAAPDPGGLAARLGYAKINPNYSAAVEYPASGPAMTATQAGTIIANAAGVYIGGIGTNTYGAAGYWTGGTTNYYNFVMVQVPNGGP
jgi:hypothetical protein